MELARIPEPEECKIIQNERNCALCNGLESDSWELSISGERRKHVGLKEKTIHGKTYGLICCACFLNITAQKNNQQSSIERRLQARKVIDKIMLESGVKQRFINCSFANFIYSQGQSRNNFSLDTTDSLFVWGKQVGCGKTHVACAIARREAWRGRPFRFVSATNLLLELRSSFSDDSRADEEDVIRKYTSPRLLIVDDIGSEKVTDYVIQSWYSIIDSRYADMKKTVYTSNLSLNELADRFGDRIASRIASGKTVHLTGKDMRLVQR